MAIRYLVNSDYITEIQDVQLNQYVQSNQSKLNRAELVAQEEVAYYLTQRYDLSYEFTNTGAWDPTIQYKVHDRVIIDYPDFQSGLTYSPGNLVIFNGEGFLNTATQSPGLFNPSDWINLGDQYTIYYTSYPSPLFDELRYYSQGDAVYWNGYTYSCQSPSHVLSVTEQAQYLYLQDVPGYNVYPDSQYNSNQQYWLRSATYSIPLGTLPTNTTYWTEGDNRCQQILYWVMDIVLFQLGKTIAPKNNLELREVAYKRALKMMDDVASGKYTISALARQGGQGTMFRAGGNTPDGYNW